MTRTAEGDALTALVLPAFELNGEFLAAAHDIATPHGLTPAWWQVLGATLDEALPVAEIARRVGLGLARQSVQRVADILVAKGWAVYVPNPRHSRAKLLQPTDAGRRHHLAARGTACLVQRRRGGRGPRRPGASSRHRFARDPGLAALPW